MTKSLVTYKIRDLQNGAAKQYLPFNTHEYGGHQRHVEKCSSGKFLSGRCLIYVLFIYLKVLTNVNSKDFNCEINYLRSILN